MLNGKLLSLIASNVWEDVGRKEGNRGVKTGKNKERECVWEREIEKDTEEGKVEERLTKSHRLDELKRKTKKAMKITYFNFLWKLNWIKTNKR